MSFSWQDVPQLYKISNELHKYNLISCDIFDTLLFRACDNPQKVFLNVGKRLIESIDNFPYTPITYMNLRREAEQLACLENKYRSGNPQYKFSEIISRLPFDEETKIILHDLEIECEHDVLYLNPYISSLLYYCHTSGLKIVLVSDMYHSKEQILSFLSRVKFDVKIVSALFVSCEWQCDKSEGKLFRILFKHFPHILPDKMLHIGDNPKADIIGAQTVGMHSVLYNPSISEFGDIYDFEKHLYHVRLGEIQTLRKLASTTAPIELVDTDLEFYKIGAEIIGPAYSLFVDWILEYALRNNVKQIAPFMREGELLSIVINNAIMFRKLPLSCKPLFISRRPAFIASIYNENYDTRISEMLLRADRLLFEILDEVGIDISGTTLSNYGSMTFRECRGNGLEQDVREFFSNNETKSMIINYAKNQRMLLLRYFEEFSNGQKVLTVDIGAKGTTESYLHKIITNEGYPVQSQNVLMMGTTTSNILNILDGVHINAWLGIAGENENEIGRIKYQIQIIESLVNANCGTILSYKNCNSNIRPILDKKTINCIHNTKISSCWAGIIAFHKLWLYLSEHKPHLCKRLIVRKKSFLGIMLRLIETPTRIEAKNIGSLAYFDRYNFSKESRLSISESEIAEFTNDIEIEDFLNRGITPDLLWPQAVVAIRAGDYFTRKLLKNMSEVPSISVMLPVCGHLKSKQCKKIVIFGASELGVSFHKVAISFGLPIICFVDSNMALHGKFIAGLKICALDAVENDIDAFVIASYIYRDEIQSILRHKYPDAGKRPFIYDFNGGL